MHTILIEAVDFSPAVSGVERQLVEVQVAEVLRETRHTHHISGVCPGTQNILTDIAHPGA